MWSVTERRGTFAAIWLLLGLVMLALAKPAGLALAQGNPDAPSPASVTSAVIALGVAEMPATTVAWRIVIDTAEPWGQAQFEQRALGFVLAREDPILLTAQDSGVRARLAAREAQFVPDGIWQRRESLAASPTTDYRIALVPAPKASDAGGDILIFAGNPFTVPPGARDLDLV